MIKLFLFYTVEDNEYRDKYINSYNNEFKGTDTLIITRENFDYFPPEIKVKEVSNLSRINKIKKSIEKKEKVLRWLTPDRDVFFTRRTINGDRKIVMHLLGNTDEYHISYNVSGILSNDYISYYDVITDHPEESEFITWKGYLKNFLDDEHDINKSYRQIEKEVFSDMRKILNPEEAIIA